MSENSIVKELLFLQSQLKHFNELLYIAMKDDPEDLLNQPKDSEQWDALSSNYKCIELDDEAAIKKSYEKFCSWIIYAKGMFTKGWK
jgi:hypothetical protein